MFAEQLEQKQCAYYIRHSRERKDKILGLKLALMTMLQSLFRTELLSRIKAI